MFNQMPHALYFYQHENYVASLKRLGYVVIEINMMMIKIMNFYHLFVDWYKLL